MTKAIITIKQERITERKTIILAEVNINGNKSVKQFSMDRNFNDIEKQEYISNKIKEDYKLEKRGKQIKDFEVEL